ncbi:hypothetical protein AB3515_06835 [Acinetobacter baumannii]
MTDKKRLVPKRILNL